MPKRVLYLIRNGEYERDMMDAGFNAPLTERGITQAKHTARALKDLPITTIYHSPHEQTEATTAVLDEQLPNTQVSVIQELQQYPQTGINQTFTRELLLKALEDNYHPQDQVEEAYRRLFQPAEDKDIHEVIVCHGNIILDLVCLATNVNPDAWSHMLINNCAINIVSVEPENKTQLMAFNDVRHLPENLRTD
jgi:serine/threonine-protein phosphatase PGAM5